MSTINFEVNHSNFVLTPEERATSVKRGALKQRAKDVKKIRDTRSKGKGLADYRADEPKNFAEPSSPTNFKVLGDGFEDAADTKTSAKENRSRLKYKYKNARANQRDLAAAAKTRKPDEMDRKLREHNRGLFAADKYKANERATESFRDLSDSRSKSVGERANVTHEERSTLNARFHGSPPGILDEESRAFANRAAGALLPPPHPKSLSAKAKFSPKAKRDAWRAKAAGSAPKTVETDLHASDRMNKTWNKVKAIVPGEIPDLD